MNWQFPQSYKTWGRYVIASCIVSLLFTQYQTVSRQYTQINDLNHELSAKSTSYATMIQHRYNRRTLIKRLEGYFESPATHIQQDTYITYTLSSSSPAKPLIESLDIFTHYRGMVHAVTLNFALQHIRIAFPNAPQ
ncbi:hypothetical protein OAJ27_01270 [bacterium]|nr:hypothetical protein [bacterium]